MRISSRYWVRLQRNTLLHRLWQMGRFSPRLRSKNMCKTYSYTALQIYSDIVPIDILIG